MRQLLLAAALALAFHSLLFTVRFEGPKATLTLPPRTLTLSLDQGPTEPPPSLAVSKISEMPEPPLHRPEAREEKPQAQKIRKPEKPSKRIVSSVLPRQEPASPSIEGHGFVSEESDASRTPHESPSAGLASPGEGDQGSKPPPVNEAAPLYRLNPAPDYPLIARKRGNQGTVVLEVLVDRQGKVADLRLSASSGYSVLDQAALASVKTWLFDPGTRGGERVDMWVKVPVRFRLE